MCAAATKTRLSAPRKRALTSVRREEIVQAAIKVFSRHGFEAARAEDIARAARIAKGTLYLYFPSKEALYSAAIAHAVAELQTLSAQGIGAAESLEEKLRVAVAIRLQFWAEHEALYRLLLTLGRETRHRKQTNALLRSGQQQLLAIFAQRPGKSDAAEGHLGSLAWALLDLIRGATERRVDRCTERTVAQDTEDIVRFVLRSTELGLH